MTSPKEPSHDPAALLELLLSDNPHDWKGARIAGVAVAAAIRLAAEEGRQRPATLLNAQVEGSIRVDIVGTAGAPLNLQVIGCRIDGTLQARHSRWRQLVIARTHLSNIDLPRIDVERELLIEEVKATGWIELRGAEIGGGLALNGSSFVAGAKEAAVTLSDVRVARSLTAWRLNSDGGVDCSRVAVGGDLALDGATLGADANGRALSLTQAHVGGRLRLCQAGADRFTANGRIMLDSAQAGSLLMKAALVDGLGGPSMVADQVRVDEAVDLSGLPAGEGEPFEARGTLRFGSARVGGQFQSHRAHLAGEGDALVLQGARIEGDVLLGHEPDGTRVDGTINLNASRLGARIVAEHLTFRGGGDALALRHAEVAGDVQCHEVRADGPIRLDNLRAAGISLAHIFLDRDPPAVDRTGLPENYAHPADALLDLSFARLETDLHVEELAIRGGDLRMIGARIPSAVQLSRISITQTPGTAIIAQSAEIGGGLQIGGSPERPGVLEGGLSAIGIEVREDITLTNLRAGTASRPVDLVFGSAAVGNGLTLLDVDLHGTLNTAGATVAGDVHIHSSRLLRPGAAALDMRNASVAGSLQLATVGQSDKPTCRIHGQVAMEGARLGSLSWKGVSVGEGTQLILSNMTVAGRISALRLVAEGKGDLSLEGTTAGMLEDRLDDANDGWGAGALRLFIDDFAYGRLLHPSGRPSDEPKTVAEWRGKWLARRADGRSARPIRHLAGVLRSQGLFEASRLQLVAAFSAEGRLRPTRPGRGLSRVFGWLFGHGLSGSRAALTLLAAWLLGAAAIIHLEDRRLLLPVKADEPAATACDKADPFLYSADTMLPLDLGVDAKCRVGAAPGTTVRQGVRIGNLGRRVLGEVETWRFALAAYQLLSWILVSLAVLTWSGLLKRGGRD